MDIDAAEIAQCCLKAYRSLPKAGGKPQRRSNGKYEWTVLSGVVMCIGEQTIAIALATGSKCMPFSQLSVHGDILHDSHAEVLVRRSLRAWLLERLVVESRSSECDPQQLPRIFVEFIDDLGNKRWRVHEETSFHLYISTLPCGEASTRFLRDRQHLEDSEQGRILRDNEHETHTRVRGRQTVTAHDGRLLRTKPGRRDSPPSISMSCTDKLFVWNAVGMQGALLSRWLEPVFFSGLVISLPENCATYVDICAVSVLPANSSHRFRVCGVECPFEHSREEVQKRINNETRQIERQGSHVNVEPVASAAEFGEWDKNGSGDEAPRRCATEVLLASKVLEDTKILFQRDYAQNKNPISNGSSHDIYVNRYQDSKRQLRGNFTTSEITKRVDQFLAENTSKSSTSSPEKHDTYQCSRGDTIPILYEWIITPSNYVAFHLDVENVS